MGSFVQSFRGGEPAGRETRFRFWDRPTQIETISNRSNANGGRFGCVCYVPHCQSHDSVQHDADPQQSGARLSAADNMCSPGSSRIIGNNSVGAWENESLNCRWIRAQNGELTSTFYSKILTLAFSTRTDQSSCYTCTDLTLQAQAFFWNAVAFTVALFTNFKALESANVETIIVFRTLSIFATAYGDFRCCHHNLHIIPSSKRNCPLVSCKGQESPGEARP